MSHVCDEGDLLDIHALPRVVGSTEDGEGRPIEIIWNEGVLVELL